MFCPKCGAENEEGSSFCGNCGSSLQEATIATESVVEETTESNSLSEQNASDTASNVSANNDKNLKKSRIKLIVIISIALILVIAAITAGVLWYLNDQADKARHRPHPVSVQIIAEGYTDEDTKIPVQINGVDLDDANVDEIMFVDPSGNGISLVKGKYTLTFPASPLTVNGILYNTPESSFDLVISEELEPAAFYDASEEIVAEFKKSDALQETDEMIKDAYDFAILDTDQQSKADQLHEVALKVHADAVAAEEARIAAEEEARRIAEEKHLALIDPKESLASYSWEELAKIAEEISYSGDSSAAIEVAKKYNLVGSSGKLDGTQVKSVQLSNGSTIDVQIAGFYHDNKTNGGKAGITFIFKDAIANQVMNTSRTSSGGWKASDMRSWLSSTGLNMLPENLKNNIVQVEKLTNNTGETGNTSSVTSTSDKLWLFSVTELCGKVNWWTGSNSKYNNVINAEGSQYKLFRDMNVSSSDTTNSILTKTSEGHSYNWWMRSPAPRVVDDFMIVQGDSGSKGGNLCNVLAPPDYDYGTVPGFCL